MRKILIKLWSGIACDELEKATWGRLTVQRFSVSREEHLLLVPERGSVLRSWPSSETKIEMPDYCPAWRNQEQGIDYRVWGLTKRAAFGSASLRHPVVFLYGIWFMISIRGNNKQSRPLGERSERLYNALHRLVLLKERDAEWSSNKGLWRFQNHQTPSSRAWAGILVFDKPESWVGKERCSSFQS